LTREARPARYFGPDYRPVTSEGWLAVAAYALGVAVIGRGIFMFIPDLRLATLAALLVTCGITVGFVRCVARHSGSLR
jgi:hypothetical protein